MGVDEKFAAIRRGLLEFLILKIVAHQPRCSCPSSGSCTSRLFLVMAAMMISLVNTGAILTWQLPPDVPLWAAAAGVGQEKIPELPRRGMTDVESLTLTGCVAQGTAVDSYTLTQSSEGAAAASDATPRLPVALTGTVVDLNKHVGQSVSVTGSYATAGLAVGTAGTEKPTVAATIEGDKTTPRSFTVKSVTMIASSCTQASD